MPEELRKCIIGTDRDEVFARAKRNNKEICSDVRVLDSTVIRDQDHANRSATIQKELQSAFEDLKGRLNAQAH